MFGVKSDFHSAGIALSEKVLQVRISFNYQLGSFSGLEYSKAYIEAVLYPVHIFTTFLAIKERALS